MNIENYTPRGYVKLTGLTTAQQPDIPLGANAVLIQAAGSAIRFRDDGTEPTADLGYPLAGGDEFWYTCSAGLAALSFIEVAPSAEVNLLFYGV